MATYVDGFVLVVPKKKVKAYVAMARACAGVWKKYGAIEYKECVGDDLVPKGIMNPFTKAYKCKPTDTVIFSFIVYKSKADRNKANAKIMTDPTIKKWMNKPMPFDMKKMSMGGFKSVVER